MYCSGVWSYIVGAITTPLFIIIPLLTIWAGIFPIVISWWAALALTIYYIAQSLVLNYSKKVSFLLRLLCCQDLPAVLSTYYTLCFATACLLCCETCHLNVLTQRLLLSCCKAGVLPANLLFFTAQLASSCQAAYDKSSVIQLLTQHVRPQQQLSNSSLICVCLRSGGILRRCGLPTSPT